MGTKKWAISTASILAICLTASLADAQTQKEPLRPLPPLPSGPQAPPEAGAPTVQGYSVVERPRPELDPLGIRLGTFFLFPRAEADGVYNDNIFATNGFRKSDFI